jgi:hypothetical protein
MGACSRQSITSLTLLEDAENVDDDDVVPMVRAS